MRFYARKIIRLVIVVFAVAVTTFVMVSLLPGDIVYAIVGQDASPQQIEELRAELGLDRPYIIRFFEWFGAALQGDLGYSIRTREGVLEALFDRLPVTVELVILSQLITVLLAVPLGVLSAFKNGKLLDRIIGSTAFAMISVPNFVFALLLIFFFSLNLGWFPATGYVPITEDFWGNLHAMILPALSLALVEWVGLMRVLRSDMISVLQEDYIGMARAKGLPNWHILFRHALRPASFSLITLLGLQIGTVLGGSLITETIFALPGLGRLLVENIYARDFMMVQGCILFIAVVYVLINFAVDMLYTVLDPRIRVEGAGG